MSPFPKLYECFDGEISVRLDLFNYVTKKNDLKKQQVLVHLMTQQTQILMDYKMRSMK